MLPYQRMFQRQIAIANAANLRDHRGAFQVFRHVIQHLDEKAIRFIDAVNFQGEVGQGKVDAFDLVDELHAAVRGPEQSTWVHLVSLLAHGIHAIGGKYGALELALIEGQKSLDGPFVDEAVWCLFNHPPGLHVIFRSQSKFSFELIYWNEKSMVRIL